MSNQQDLGVLRELARRYAEIAALPIQAERRRLWADHFSLKPTRPPILVSFGMHNVWCRQVFSDAEMCCQDPFYRSYERMLRMAIFHHEEVGDDAVQEPWLTVWATMPGGWGRMWGVDENLERSEIEGGAGRYQPPLTSWDAVEKLRPTPHQIDEAATQKTYERLADAVGDLIAINVTRTPAYAGYMADISTSLAMLRGLEQLMLDMIEHPRELHRLLAFMRDSILANNAAGEAAGHYTTSSSENQAQPYANDLPWPQANGAACSRKQLWTFCEAQEFTSVSPAFHEEFLLQYQRPILEHFGLVHYGCCEDLTLKIDILRQLPNLRSIAVTPAADLARCAALIGRDYVFSWRPNPTDVICCGWHEERIRKVIRDGLTAARDCQVHIRLKDIETVEGDVSRLGRLVRIIRDIADEAA